MTNKNQEEENSSYPVDIDRFEYMEVMFFFLDITTCEDPAMIQAFTVHQDQRKCRQCYPLKPLCAFLIMVSKSCLIPSRSGGRVILLMTGGL